MRLTKVYSARKSTFLSQIVLNLVEQTLLDIFFLLGQNIQKRQQTRFAESFDPIFSIQLGQIKNIIRNLIVKCLVSPVI